MNIQHRLRLVSLVGVLFAFLMTAPAWAHFLWLKTLPVPDGKPIAFLYFGENADDEAYHFPEKLESVKLFRRTPDGKRAELESQKLEIENRIGRTAPLKSDDDCVLEAAGQYGVYEAMLLSYYAKHVRAASNDKLGAAGPAKALKLDIIPKQSDGQLQLTVLWNGKPLADAELLVTVGDDEIFEIKTNDKGQAMIRPEGSGLVGVLANYTEKDVQGELAGKKYTSGAHYATVTFPWQTAGKPAAEATTAADSQPNMPALPEPLSSFGAVVVDGWLYVYGGHIGKEHAHSAANLSQHFRRIRLADPGTREWEDLSMQTPLQGLPLVAHDGKVYRVGGLSARNATTDDKEDLHSTAEFAQFDPATGQWTALAPLPAPRSSHNATVIGDKLYVVGGWQLEGKSPGTWQPAALVYDFGNPEGGWQELTEPPIKCRALAVGHWNGKLAALGGMDEKGRLSKRVYLFEPQTGVWSRGPDLPGAGMANFGPSAWNLNGSLYVSGFRGDVHRLNDEGSAWEEVAHLATPRFFHQLVPADNGGLLAVGGASEEGHLDSIEWIDVDARPAAAEPRKANGERASSERAPPVSHDSRAESQVPDEVATTSSGSRLSSTGSQPVCHGDVWPAFRGLGNSLTAARNLPLHWSDGENVAWNIELPGYGQSSPIVWRDAVFVTTMQGDNKETPTILCYDLATGQKRWQREFKSSQPIEATNMVTRSSPTPAVDAERVYAFFESGDLYAFDHAGNPAWRRSLVSEYGEFTGLHGVGSSLAQTDEAIIVLVNHEGPSYIASIDKSTGKNIWKVDYAGRVAWSSPIVTGGGGEQRVIVSAAGVVEAYDAASGARKWRLDGLTGNTVPSATVAGPRVFVGSQEVKSNVAIDVSAAEPQFAWRAEQASCNFMSPLVLDGLVYMVNRSGVAFCLDADTGEQLWKHRLSDTCWASPVGAGDRVYFFAKDGTTVVARAGRQFEPLAENQLEIDAQTRVYGVAAVDGAFILRTGTRLVCVGQPTPKSAKLE